MRLHPRTCASKCSAFKRGLSIFRFLKYTVVDSSTSSTVIFELWGTRAGALQIKTLRARRFPQHLQVALSHRPLAVSESIRRDRHSLRDPGYKASNQYDDRSHGSAENG